MIEVVGLNGSDYNHMALIQEPVYINVVVVSGMWNLVCDYHPNLMTPYYYTTFTSLSVGQSTDNDELMK